MISNEKSIVNKKKKATCASHHEIIQKYGSEEIIRILKEVQKSNGAV